MSRRPASQKLMALAARLEARIKEASVGGAEIVAEKAREIVAVDTGELRDSIEVRAEEDGVAEVVAGTDHAAAVEFGTPYAAAQPFLRPAARQTEGEVIQYITTELRDEIARG